MSEELEQTLRSVLQGAVQYATGTLQAERVMVVYQGYGLAYGLDTATLWTSGEISTSLLSSLLEEREPMVMLDAAEDPRTRDQTSAVLSSLRSVLFLPLPNPAGSAGGLFYADHRRRAGAFTAEQLEAAQQALEAHLIPKLFAIDPEATGDDMDFTDLEQTHWL